MNNDLKQFSEERLMELIHESSKPEIEVLARIALAAKQAKPIGYLEHSHYEYLQSGINAEIWPKGDAGDIPVYTTPQPAHTEQDDTLRMNWLVSQHVEVRTPMVYGSHARFVAQCDSDDSEEYHTTLREQIDKAMPVTAPKPEGE